MIQGEKKKKKRSTVHSLKDIAVKGLFVLNEQSSKAPHFWRGRLSWCEGSSSPVWAGVENHPACNWHTLQRRGMESYSISFPHACLLYATQHLGWGLPCQGAVFLSVVTKARRGTVQMPEVVHPSLFHLQAGWAWLRGKTSEGKYFLVHPCVSWGGGGLDQAAWKLGASLAVKRTEQISRLCLLGGGGGAHRPHTGGINHSPLLQAPITLKPSLLASKELKGEGQKEGRERK